MIIFLKPLVLFCLFVCFEFSPEDTFFSLIFQREGKKERGGGVEKDRDRETLIGLPPTPTLGHALRICFWLVIDSMTFWFLG